jgi:hypothetical protein
MVYRRGFLPEIWALARFMLRKKAGVIGVGVLFPIGLAMLYGGDYVLGIIAIGLTAACWIAAWLISEELQNRKPQPPRKQKYVQLEKYRHDSRRYVIWKFSVPAIIVAAFFLSSLFVNYKREETILKELDGFLLPASDPDPPNSCKFEIAGHNMMPDTALKVFLGKFMVSYSSFPHKIFTINGKNPLVLNRDSSGRIALTMDIFDKDEKIVVRFDNGHFTVNQNARLDMNRPDRSTLIVHDNYGNEVLNIRYLNKQAVVISALLQYSHANPVQIQKTQFADVCLGDVGSVGINFDSPK